MHLDYDFQESLAGDSLAELCRLHVDYILWRHWGQKDKREGKKEAVAECKTQQREMCGWRSGRSDGVRPAGCSSGIWM